MQTNKNNTKKERVGVILCIIACAIFLSIFFITSGAKQKSEKALGVKTTLEQTTETKTSPPEQTKEKGIKTILEINNQKYESYLDQPTSTYDFMVKLKKEDKINFKEDTYAGLGKFIREINGVNNNGGMYWIYYVNGIKAKVGISNYIINGGDTVSWKYEKDLN